MFTQTADGRDLREAQWRPLPEFPKYEITPDGDVRNARFGKLLKEHQNPVTGVWAYTLRKEMRDGTNKNHTRTWASLVKSAYPENVA